MIRTVYLGNNDGYARICAAESDLQAVFWHTPKGNLALRSQAMRDYCADRNIPTFQHDRLTPEAVEQISALKPELIVVGEYHLLLKSDLINLPRLGVINMHGAPLPRYRGAHPIQWMVIEGETEGAVTCHYLSEGLDSGDIIDQYTFPILSSETAGDLRPKLEATGQRLLCDVLRRFNASGTRLPATPQDESRALYKTPRTPEDGLIDWRQSAKRIYDFVRALTHPYPGAFTFCKSERIMIWRVDEPAAYIKDQALNAPGTILRVGTDHFCVATANGSRVTIRDWEPHTIAIAAGDILDSR